MIQMIIWASVSTSFTQDVGTKSIGSFRAISSDFEQLEGQEQFREKKKGKNSVNGKDVLMRWNRSIYFPGGSFQRRTFCNTMGGFTRKRCSKFLKKRMSSADFRYVKGQHLSLMLYERVILSVKTKTIANQRVSV